MMTSDLTYGSPQWFEREYLKVAEDPWGLSWRPSQAFRYQTVLRALDEIRQPIDSIIDVGCATGEFTHLLQCRYPQARTLGVDFVDAAVHRARTRFPAVRFANTSIMSLGTTHPDEFDLLSCLEVLYYIPAEDRVDALASMRRSIRAGRYAAFSSMVAPPPYFSPAAFRELISHEFEVVDSVTVHLRVVSLVEKVGGRVQRMGVRPNGAALRRTQFGRMSLQRVTSIERWSRRLLGTAAMSHVIVLARVPTAA
jgi:ubiquinone/menaquinone biosynthesis C-methylase UbiE